LSSNVWTTLLVYVAVAGCWFLHRGVFSLYTIWLPEMFPSSQRGAGADFTFSLGRVFGAAGLMLIGSLGALTGSFPIAISVLSLIYVIGLPFISLAPETANKPLAA
jgi:hypothetical protein